MTTCAASPPDAPRLAIDRSVNAEVYVLYLRARDLETHQSMDDYRSARDLYLQATQLDPRFALAHARLGLVLSVLAKSPEEKAAARTEVERALSLEPHLGEAHFVLAEGFQAAGDNGSATHEIDEALRDAPDDSQIVYLAASLHRRQGKWDQSLAEFRKALSLDPRNLNAPTDLAYHLSQMRDWPAAVQAWDRALAIAPEWMFNKICRAYLDFWARGDLARANALLENVPVNYQGLFAEFLQWMRWDVSLIERNPAAAEEAIAAMTSDPLVYGYPPPTPKSYFRGCAALVRGDRDAAHAEFEQARAVWEAELLAQPKNARLHAQLGLLYAFMGRKEDALREGERASEIMPVKEDAFDGTGVQTTLALIYAQVGEAARSVALLRHLLAVPGALNYDTSITLNDLRQRWQWDPLRENAEFKALVASHEAFTPPSR
ncbi:MAG: tetratricopeptide repeat protein [Chthoniobacterales bacterium]